MTPHISRIRLYPIKALDGVPVTEARVLPSGALEHDREWAIVTTAGEIVNGRRTPLVHRLRSSYDASFEHVTINGTTFRIGDEALDAFLSDYFGERVALRHFPRGTPDHLKRMPGPSIVSAATLTEVASWSNVSVDEIRRRFRITLEIDGVAPFWEDQLVRTAHATNVRIGDTRVSVMEHCARCVVPSRNPDSGDAIAGFQKAFLMRRREQLPEWSEQAAFPHFYHLGVLTRAEGDAIRVGDDLVVEGPGARPSVLAPLRRLRKRLTFRPR